MDYHEENHPTLEITKIKTYYLCGKLLDNKSTPDHIIPKSLFAKGSPN